MLCSLSSHSSSMAYSRSVYSSGSEPTSPDLPLSQASVHSFTGKRRKGGSYGVKDKERKWKFWWLACLAGFACLLRACKRCEGSNRGKMTNRQVMQEVVKWKDGEYARKQMRVYFYELDGRYNRELVDESHRNPPKIRDPFCDESFYSAEVTLMNYFRYSPVRTMNASEADYFYVPVLTTCFLMTHLPNDVNRTGRFFAEAMKGVIEDYPYWNQSDGRDHIMMFAQGFGARLGGEWKKYRNAIFLVHNGDYEEEHFDAHKDMVVAPDLQHYLKPVGMTHGERLLRKKNFVLFGGQVVNESVSDHRGSNYSGGVRQYIQRELGNVEGYKVTGVRSETYIEDMVESVFCLAPHGWHKWSPRPAYAVLLGCVPVLISEGQMLFWEHIIRWEEMSVWIRPGDVGELDRKLRSVKREELEEMERGLREVWRLFWYAEGGLGGEAVLYGLHRRLGGGKRRTFL